MSHDLSKYARATLAIIAILICSTEGQAGGLGAGIRSTTDQQKQLIEKAGRDLLRSYCNIDLALLEPLEKYKEANKTLTNAMNEIATSLIMLGEMMDMGTATPFADPENVTDTYEHAWQMLEILGVAKFETFEQSIGVVVEWGLKVEAQLKETTLIGNNDADIDTANEMRSVLFESSVVYSAVREVTQHSVEE